ncbi:1944_t:CDS:2, partial [Ambispora leptoticha]
EQHENKIDDADSVSQEMMSEADKAQSKPEATEENSREPWIRFSVMGEVAERIKREVIQEEVIEIRGYLRNEHLRIKREGEAGEKYIEKKVGRQIIIKVVEFSKLDLDFEKIDQDSSNQVRLLGKIITDLQDPEKKRNPEILSFKLAVPREGVKSPLFFCRINEKELISEVNKKLKGGDIILLEGFLQTQKIEEERGGDKKEIS